MIVLRRNRFIYFVIVIILITGMCFMNYKTDSYFSYLQSVWPPNAIFNGVSPVQNPDICTQKMLGQQCIIISDESMKEIGLKSSIKTIMILIFLQMLLVFFKLNRILEDRSIYILYSVNKVIVWYMHLKDGKKRRHCYS